MEFKVRRIIPCLFLCTPIRWSNLDSSDWRRMLPKFYEVLEDHKIVPFQVEVFLDGSKGRIWCSNFWCR